MKPITEWYKDELIKMDLHLDIPTGHLFYAANFKPLNIKYDLIFIRHGETFGNCGQSLTQGKINTKLVDLNIRNFNNRIFQGYVDGEINQLTVMGKKQAYDVALYLENEYLSKGWLPDAVFYSPLSRAKDTGLPFVMRNNLLKVYQVHEGIKEMSFGAWDNRRICDFSQEDECHLFYKNQHSLVKMSGINGNGHYQEAENFCDVILRAHKVLLELNEKYINKKIILFSHSIFGAACSILRGLGQQIEHGEHLAFDGKRKNGVSYLMPHTKPITL